MLLTRILWLVVALLLLFWVLGQFLRLLRGSIHLILILVLVLVLINVTTSRR